MQPQQPYYPPAPAPAPPPPNTGQYDFITGGSYQQPRSYGPQNPKKMILFVIIGAVVVIALVWMILSMVFGGNNDQLKPLISVAQQQTEIVRVTNSALQGDNISSQDVKNFVENTKLTIGTDKGDTVSFMSKNGLKVKDKEMAAAQSSKTDDALAAAKANSTYDTTLVQIVQDELQTYERSLKQAYAGTSNKVIREVLSDKFNNAELLLQQSKQRS